MNIYITKIPHARQAYDTVGDWRFDKAPDDKHAREFLDIKVSDLGNEDFEFLVAIHELTEAWLCRKRGISGEAVTAFDMRFEEDRAQEILRLSSRLENISPEHPEDAASINHEIDEILAEEPGDHPAAPYFREHRFANIIERRVAEGVGVDWNAYEQAIAEAK